MFLYIFCFVVEHMLFYASEKYPEEDSYSKYIAEVPFLILHNLFLVVCIFIFYFLADVCKLTKCMMVNYELFDCRLFVLFQII